MFGQNPAIDHGIVATAYLHRSAMITAKAAEVLGLTEVAYQNALVYAKVTNLFDETYVPWLSASATENGQGRTFHIGTSLRF